MEKTNECEGINHKGKLREIRVQRLFEKHYPDELKKMKVLCPVDRSSLISHLLYEADSKGFSEGAIVSSCNTVMTKVGLPELTESSFSYLRSNGSLNDISLDRAVQVGINQMFLAGGEQEQYTSYHLVRNSDEFSVSTPSIKLSGNEAELLQNNRTEKLRESIRDKFFQKFDTLFPIFSDLVLNEESLEEYIETHQSKFKKGKMRYHEYLSVVDMYEHHLYNSEYSSILKAPQKLNEVQFNTVLKSIQDGQRRNIPLECFELVIFSILR